MNRRNGRCVEQHKLAFNMLAVVGLSQGGCQGPADTGAHFCRCRFGECHHQHSADVDGTLLVDNALNDALYQHRRFAGSGGGGYQQILAAAGDSLLLFV